jgi:hypothetical protein
MWQNILTCSVIHTGITHVVVRTVVLLNCAQLIRLMKPPLRLICFCAAAAACVQLVCRIIQANGFDKPVVLDSPAAAAELAQSRQASQATAGAVATQAQAATQSGSPGTAHNGNTTAVTQGSSVVPSSSSRGSTQAGAQIQVLVAWKSRDWTAGAAELDTATGVDMRPDNVEAWFTKVGSHGVDGLCYSCGTHFAFAASVFFILLRIDCQGCDY